MIERRTAATRGMEVLLALALALVGCGGGGGGGEGPSDTGNSQVPLELVNVQSFGTTQVAIEGSSSLGNVTLRADVKGTLSALSGQTVYVVVEDPDALFNQTAPGVAIFANGLGNEVVLRGNGLTGRAGHYTGTLKIHVCLDTACTRPFGNSPLSVPYDITVQPGVRIMNTGPLAIEADFGTLPVTCTHPVYDVQVYTPSV